jgi:hypothetical protein
MHYIIETMKTPQEKEQDTKDQLEQELLQQIQTERKQREQNH